LQLRISERSKAELLSFDEIISCSASLRQKRVGCLASPVIAAKTSATTPGFAACGEGLKR